MTDSEGEGISRRDLEQRVQRIIEDTADGSIRFDEMCRLLGVDPASPEADKLSRFLRSLPTVELVSNPTTSQRIVRRAAALASSHATAAATGASRAADRKRKGYGKRNIPDEPKEELDREVGRVGYMCIADEFDLAEIKKHYEKAGLHVRHVVDVLHVCPKVTTKTGDYGTIGSATTTTTSAALVAGGGHFDMFVFEYGVVVWWGVNTRQFSIVESDFALPSSSLNKFFVNRFKTALIRENFPVWCTYSSDTREHLDPINEPDHLFAEKLKFDHFLIRDNSADVKLCVSHALAQSAKIDYLEIKVAQLTQQCKPLPRQLKERGAVTISERGLLQLQGEVLYFRLMLKSGSDLLDEPELFWQNPWLKPLYEITKSSFQIQNRVETLDAKLDAANEILSLISDQFKHSHGSRLEWIVIWLVLVEVIIGVLELLVDIKPWFAGGGGGANNGAHAAAAAHAITAAAGGAKLLLP